MLVLLREPFRVELVGVGVVLGVVVDGPCGDVYGFSFTDLEAKIRKYKVELFFFETTQWNFFTPLERIDSGSFITDEHELKSSITSLLASSQTGCSWIPIFYKERPTITRARHIPLSISAVVCISEQNKKKIFNVQQK